MRKGMSRAVGALAWIWSGLVWACWDEAAARYQLSPDLLYAIAKCESNLRPDVVNRSHYARTGTYDIGLMQINSSNLRRLETYGITESQLYDACTNIEVGAWILADKVRAYGFSWEAVGAYNAACVDLKGRDCAAARSKYSWCVYRNLAAPRAPLASSRRARAGAHAPPVAPIISTRVSP